MTATTTGRFLALGFLGMCLGILLWNGDLIAAAGGLSVMLSLAVMSASGVLALPVALGRSDLRVLYVPLKYLGLGIFYGVLAFLFIGVLYLVAWLGELYARAVAWLADLYAGVVEWLSELLSSLGTLPELLPKVGMLLSTTLDIVSCWPLNAVLGWPDRSRRYG